MRWQIRKQFNMPASRINSSGKSLWSTIPIRGPANRSENSEWLPLKDLRPNQLNPSGAELAPSGFPINLGPILWCLIKGILDGTAGQCDSEATGNSIILCVPRMSVYGLVCNVSLCLVMWVYGLLHKLACPIWSGRRSKDLVKYIPKMIWVNGTTTNYPF